jgi:hypothetical protein
VSPKLIEGAKLALLAGILLVQGLSYFQDKEAISAYIVGVDPFVSIDAKITDMPQAADVVFPNPMPICVSHGSGTFRPCDDLIDVGTVGGQ